MTLLQSLLDIALHLDRHLLALTQDYGAWIYAILFLIVFIETGLVVMPFLPGDSLLFVAGALAALGRMQLDALALTVMAAALCGDNVNYWVGRYLGQRVFAFPDSRFFRRENLLRAHEILERYGAWAIILARFMPLIRTFMPFACGVGSLTYRRFLLLSFCAALLWAGLLLPAGYFFGNIPFVRENLTFTILLIIFLSLLPALIGGARLWWQRRQALRALK